MKILILICSITTAYFTKAFITCRIGGNPGLSPQGLKYARALGAHVNSLNIHGLKVRRERDCGFISIQKTSSSK